MANSTSPDGQFHIAVEEPSNPNEMARYRAVTRDGAVLPGSFPSDYRHGNPRTSVFWGRDASYFVLEEPETRHHQEFVIAKRARDGFVSLPFDRGSFMAATGFSCALAGVDFDRWLPHDRIALTIRGTWVDGFRAELPPYECGFVLDLKDGLRIVSFEIRRPTPAERAKASK